MSEEKNEEKQYNFVQKVWIVGLIFSLIVTVLLIFEATFDLLVLVLAGALIACYFRGLSDLIHKKIKWNQKVTLSIATIGSLLIVFGVIYFTQGKKASITLSDTRPNILAYSYVSKDDIHSMIDQDNSSYDDLAIYLKNGGSIEILLKEPANAKKFREVMKNEVYRFSLTPVMSGIVDGGQIAGLVESIQSSRRVSERLFGIQK